MSSNLPLFAFSRGLLFGMGLSVLLSLTAAQSRADYEPLGLHELFGQSDLVVHGTIEEVKDKTFLLKEYKVLHGAGRANPLEVKRFIDWSGNSRWGGYQEGQEVLLFLTRPERESDECPRPWEIRGHGGEGEMPVEQEFVYLHGLFLEGFQRQRFTVQHGILEGYRFHLDAFLAALKGYNRCFWFAEGSEKTHSSSIVQHCDDETLATFRQQATLNRYLVEKTLQDISTR